MTWLGWLSPTLVLAWLWMTTVDAAGTLLLRLLVGGVIAP